jgi:hypothetical protein
MNEEVICYSILNLFAESPYLICVRQSKEIM